ncbi:CcdB family protein [Sphingomonas panacis]|uniref:CcdB family protein n=1 Tax=Sphingomonas panacis TaxID=1560345 RepID=UPI001F0AA2BC|nr:CcdB family protein [Sphingomonas panacis]
MVDVFDSRFVVPLVRPGSINVPIRRLMPAFDVAGEQRVMATPFASAMAKWALGPAIGSLAAHDLEISMALDVLISGI